jgi:ATP-dependent RNA helicase SUPV3L1/SUV3
VTSPTPSESDPTTHTAPAISAEPEIQPVADAIPTTPPSAEPTMIEVWRPGRPRPDRKPEHKRPQKRTEAKADGAAPAEGEKTRERPRRDKRGKDRKEHRHERAPRKDASQFKPRPERREKPLDPNSPFASLLALKERMEADKKDKG